MGEKEMLLEQLDEYNAALERLDRDFPYRDQVLTTVITRQLSHLERRVLQVQTQLSLLDIQVWQPSRHLADSDRRCSVWARLNPWHPDFHIGAYVALLTLFMLAALLLQIALGQSLAAAPAG